MTAGASMPWIKLKSTDNVTKLYVTGAKLALTVFAQSIQSPLLGGSPPMVEILVVETLLLMTFVWF